MYIVSDIMACTLAVVIEVLFKLSSWLLGMFPSISFVNVNQIVEKDERDYIFSLLLMI